MLIAILLGGSLMLFVNAPSILIVVVGSLFTVMTKFDMADTVNAFKAIGFAFNFESKDKQEIIDKCVDMAQIARKEGALGLDGIEIENPFMKKGVGYLVDGVDTDVIRHILAKEKRLAEERHESAAEWFSFLGDTAPAMGMIGTLVGLVQMLANMSDPKAIGPAMAVALLTTLYGAIIANMFAIPISGKLKQRSGEEAEIHALIIDSILHMSEGIHPRLVKESLDNYINEKLRTDEEGAKEAA